MSKEKPILFSTPMVQAILDGRKTMTRQVIPELIDKDAWLVGRYSGRMLVNHEST